jgi:hypothetical protein
MIKNEQKRARMTMEIRESELGLDLKSFCEKRSTQLEKHSDSSIQFCKQVQPDWRSILVINDELEQELLD